MGLVQRTAPTGCIGHLLVDAPTDRCPSSYWLRMKQATRVTSYPHISYPLPIQNLGRRYAKLIPVNLAECARPLIFHPKPNPTRTISQLGVKGHLRPGLLLRVLETLQIEADIRIVQAVLPPRISQRIGMSRERPTLKRGGRVHACSAPRKLRGGQPKKLLYDGLIRLFDRLSFGPDQGHRDILPCHYDQPAVSFSPPLEAAP
jgi:hypothetical protein